MKDQNGHKTGDLLDPPRKKPGKPRQYVNDAARQRAFRQRQADGLIGTKQLAVTVPSEVFVWLDGEAKRRSMSRSQFMTLVIQFTQSSNAFPLWCEVLEKNALPDGER